MGSVIGAVKHWGRHPHAAGREIHERLHGEERTAGQRCHGTTALGSVATTRHSSQSS